MTTAQADALQDAGLARTDLDIVAAALAEIEDRIAADRLDATSVKDVAADVFPRLTAIHAYLLDLCAEVAA